MAEKVYCMVVQNVKKLETINNLYSKIITVIAGK